MPDWQSVVIFESKRNLMQKSNLINIQQIISRIQNIDLWKSVCFLAADSDSCHDDSFLSPLNFLNKIGDLNQSDINNQFQTKMKNPKEWKKINHLFGNQEMIFWTNGKV